MKIIIERCLKQLPLELSEREIEKLKDDEAETVPVMCNITGGLITLRVNFTDNGVELACTRTGVCDFCDQK